jgi:hypothetical protein
MPSCSSSCNSRAAVVQQPCASACRPAHQVDRLPGALEHGADAGHAGRPHEPLLLHQIIGALGAERAVAVELPGLPVLRIGLRARSVGIGQHTHRRPYWERQQGEAALTSQSWYVVNLLA